MNLPNLLTYGRVAAVPVVVGFLVLADEPWARWSALAVYIIAAITDFFDGYLARAWSQQSSLGRMLDPIADKLLVAAVLLMLTADRSIDGLTLWAAIIILCREILVSGLREYLAELRVPMPVTAVAKWKTAAQLVALGFLIAGPGGRSRAAGLDRDGHRAAVGRRAADAVHRLGLYEGELRSRRRLSVKAVYFAWVRERIGKAEEEIDPPPRSRRSATSSAG